MTLKSELLFLRIHEFNDELFLVPKIVDGGTNPGDFPFPCQFDKFSRDA